MPKSPHPDLWKEERYQVWQENEKGEKVDPFYVSGVRLGMLAIHFNPNKELWELRSLSSKYRIVSVQSTRDAMLIGEELWEKARRALSLADKKSINAAVPDWIKNWLRECNSQKKYINPVPFETGRGA